MFRIGPHVIDPPYLLAPMASVSEMPFRVIAFELGAGLATTELISAKGIFYKNRRTRQYLTHDAAREVPYSVQLFGGDPEPMAVAAKAAMDHGAHMVDINMGCPVKKVTKTGSGSALLTDPVRAANLVRVMREAVNDAIPITAKIRTGWDAHTINCIEMTHALEEAGCAALAVHGRTRAQAYRGEADWSWIGAMKDAAQAMPIIGNGDVRTVADAQRMMSETGCDGVMIGRGALGNPWIFRSLKAGYEIPVTAAERQALVLRHLDDHIAFHEGLGAEVGGRKLRVPPAEVAVRTFRQHLIWYSRGLRGGGAFRQTALQLDTPDEVRAAVRGFFGSLDDAAPTPPPASSGDDEGGDGGAGDGEVGDDGIDYRQAYG